MIGLVERWDNSTIDESLDETEKIINQDDNKPLQLKTPIRQTIKLKMRCA